jgi:hypothetical protein
MVTFNKHKWWILTALLTVPLVALAAGVPNVFAPNTVISSANVNANFSNLSDRVTALETAIQAKASATTVKVVMDNVLGPMPLATPATVTTTGGPLTLVVSGSGWRATSAGIIDVTVQFAGVTIGDLKVTTNETNSHKALPTKVFQVTPPPAAGTYAIGLLPVTGTTTDSSDYFNVTAIELGH